MEVLDRKFELPLSKQKLREKGILDRLNGIKTQESGEISTSFSDLKGIDTKNKPQPTLTSKPAPSPRKPTPTKKLTPRKDNTPPPPPDPLKKLDIKKPTVPAPPPKNVKPSPETEDKAASIEEDADPKPPTKNIELQFRWTEPPPGLINMPNDASNLDMMRTGGGVDNLKPGAWQRAWSILDFHDPDDSLSTYETIKVRTPRASGAKFTDTFSSAFDGIYRYANDDKVKIGEAGPGLATKLFDLNNQLLRVENSKTAGSPVDKYDIEANTWTPYAGTPPYDPLLSDQSASACIHKGEVYLASHYYIWKSTGGSWSKYYNGIIGPGTLPLIYDLTSDGENIFAVLGSITGLRPPKSELGVYKVTSSSATKIAHLSDNSRYHSTLDYESKTGKLYASVNDRVNTHIYSLSTAGSLKPLFTTDGDYLYTGVATGDLFGYLSAGKKVYRLGDNDGEVEYTEIYSSDNEQRYLTSFEEQIGIGESAKFFHTEMEGSIVRCSHKGQDSKFPT